MFEESIKSMKHLNIGLSAFEPMASKYLTSGFPIHGFNIHNLVYKRHSEHRKGMLKRVVAVTVKVTISMAVKDTVAVTCRKVWVAVTVKVRVAVIFNVTVAVTVKVQVVVTFNVTVAVTVKVWVTVTFNATVVVTATVTLTVTVTALSRFHHEIGELWKTGLCLEAH